MNRFELSKLVLSPLLSEKSGRVRSAANCFVFKVPVWADKFLIKKVVETRFAVQASSVRVLKMKGVVRNFARIQGKTKDWKKAYVTLKPGHVIDQFEA